MSDLTAIKAAIYEMSLLFNQQPADERIAAYAKNLTQFTPEQIIFAFRQEIRKGSAFFPSLAEIISHLRPKEVSPDAIAAEVAEEIMRAVVNGDRFELLSEVAQKTIGSQYGMSLIGEADRSQIPTNKAQLRMQAKAVVERDRKDTYDVWLKKLGLPTSAAIESGAPKELA